MSPFEEDLNRFDTENELEDGFSFATEDADGFDSDAVRPSRRLNGSQYMPGVPAPHNPSIQAVLYHGVMLHIHSHCRQVVCTVNTRKRG